LGLSVDEYHEWLVEIRGLNVASLEYSGSEQGRDLLSYLPAAGDNLPSVLLERSELERLLASSIDRIPAIERTVLSLYYHEELTLREIAEVVNLHESRISQLKSQAILRLRGQMAVQWPAAHGMVGA
jgi:RNA polymerase sigma factor for flagellar operon FliA